MPSEAFGCCWNAARMRLEHYGHASDESRRNSEHRRITEIHSRLLLVLHYALKSWLVNISFFFFTSFTRFACRAAKKEGRQGRESYSQKGEKTQKNLHLPTLNSAHGKFSSTDSLTHLSLHKNLQIKLIKSVPSLLIWPLRSHLWKGWWVLCVYMTSLLLCCTEDLLTSTTFTISCECSDLAFARMFHQESEHAGKFLNYPETPSVTDRTRALQTKKGPLKTSRLAARTCSSLSGYRRGGKQEVGGE